MTKRELAEISIRNAIESGLYIPGQVVSQRQIGEDLGLGVTPIREAILVLSGNGIVERHTHHSIRVSQIDAERLKKIFFVRDILEVQAVRMAALASDDALITKLEVTNRQIEAYIGAEISAEVNELDRIFHSAIFSACGNDALVWSIDRVKSSFPMYALWDEPGRIETSTSEHWQLINALKERDAEAAAKAQAVHLSNGLRATIAYLNRLIPDRSKQE